MFAEKGDFVLQPSYFRHASWLHGINHTYRVMCHVLMMGSKLGFVEETRLAFCAAFVHDMERRHDGLCLRHGARAAKEKVPQFTGLFLRNGIRDKDIEVIKTAVTNHSQFFDLNKKHPHYTVTALLKDADALDRIRLGERNLNKKYLRFTDSAHNIGNAEKLFYSSQEKEDISLPEMMSIACEIFGKPLIY